MISVFNSGQITLGAFAGTINPMTQRGSTAAIENTNETYWQIETGG